MKIQIIIIVLLFSSFSYSQENERLSTVDFVEILSNNREEARFYYQNNWQIIREIALNEGYIHSFQILETIATPDAPYHLILITTYTNQSQYDKREVFFNKIIKAQDGLKLLNAKKPNDFRKVVIRKDVVNHWY